MKSSSPPPAPDYAGAAKQQGTANLESAVATAKLSNPNTYGPLGSQTVTYGTGDQQYTPTITQTLTPNAQATLNAQQGVERSLAELGQQGVGQAKTILGTPFTPNLPGIQTDISGSVSPVNQSAYTAGNAQGAIGGPTLKQGIDTSGIAAMPVNAGMTGQQAIMSRLEPQLTQNEGMTRQRLANQGLVPGGEAYNNEMRTMGQNRNDLELQAAAQGINLDAAMNQQGFNQAQTQGQFGNEAQLAQFNAGLQNAGLGNTAINQNFNNQLAAQSAQNAAQTQNYNQQLGLAQFGNTAQGQSLDQQLALRNQPLNQITGLMSGSQIQMPQFQGYTGANVAAAPIYQAANDQYNAAMQQYGIKQQNANSTMGGLMSLGSSAMGAGAMFA